MIADRHKQDYKMASTALGLLGLRVLEFKRHCDPQDPCFDASCDFDMELKACRALLKNASTWLKVAKREKGEQNANG